MRQASVDLLGSHDFRSFCKLEITKAEPTFIRRIDGVQIEALETKDDNGGYQMCELIVDGSGFLWHQIRCIVALLVCIGQGKEEVSLIKTLLDIEK